MGLHRENINNQTKVVLQVSATMGLSEQIIVDTPKKVGFQSNFPYLAMPLLERKGDTLLVASN